MSTPQPCDLLVVGAGPAGVAAALQAARDRLDVVVVADEPVGGLVRAARWIENLPALFPGLSGPQLAGRLVDQLGSWKITPRADKLLRLERVEGGYLGTLASGAQLCGETVVLATGTEASHYAPAGLEACRERGRVHRDLRTVPELQRGDEALVVGGGDAALDTALSLRDRGLRVTLAVRGKALRANARLAEAAVQAGVLVRLRCVVVAAKPVDDQLELGLHTADQGTQSQRFATLVACVGRVPRDRLLGPLGQQIGDPGEVASALPGLYLAGDLIRGQQRYVATAFGDGQRAALLAAAHLDALRRRRSTPR